MAKPILIIGLPDAGPEMLPPIMVERINQARLLVGGKRHLARFPDARGEQLPITANIGEVVAGLRAVLDVGADSGGGATNQAVVLASGDPLWFGIGATLRRYFKPEELDIRPAPSSAQLAFAALGEPWAGAALLSAHARPIEDVVQGCATVERAAILTDPTHTPAVIAEALLAAGHAAQRPVAITENLGGPNQRIWRGTLASVAEQQVGRLNVFVLLPNTS
ncbi:MAG: precorrin-6y C5,15-methyltransferase (decarboxylating) subunit CbiE, partial [Ardenticatenaceae bacterium]